MITASVYMGGALAYALMASGERQEWSKIESEDNFDSVGENTFVSEASTAAASDYGTNGANN